MQPLNRIQSNQQLNKERQSLKQNRPSSPKIRANIPSDNSCTCPHCLNTMPVGLAICPECGYSLIRNKCSFCGSPMKETAKFCSKCGQSHEGISCPQCGTLNARNFCRVCNIPLTAMGQQALEQAKNDPQFKALQAKANELVELQAKIEQYKNNPSKKGEPKPELSVEDKQLLDDYASLLASIGVAHPKTTTPTQSAKPQTQERVEEHDMPSLEDMMKTFKEKAEEMNQELAKLVPPPELSIELQRDFMTARKVAPNAIWICNWCSYKHYNPSQCGNPSLGGVWVMEVIED